MKYKINYKNVLKSVVDGILVVDLGGYLVDVNQEFADMLGYKKNGLIGKHAAGLSPCNTPDFLVNTSLSALETLIREGQVENREVQYAKKDGSIVYAEANISGLFDDKENLEGYIFAVRVIPDRKTSERNQLNNEELLKKIINEVPSFIFVKDQSGKYVLAGKAFSDYVGLSPDSIIGKSNSDLVDVGKISIHDAKAIKKAELEVLITGKDLYLSSQRISQSNGKVKWFRTSKIPLNQNGKPKYVLTVAFDITELRNNFDFLKKKDRQLSAKNKELEELNVTLEVLIQQKDKDRLELEKKVLSSIKLLVEPYLEKLDHLCSKPINKNLIEIIKTNLKEVVSPFTHNLSSKYINFSPNQIHVANLIQQGFRNKEISEIMNISPETVAVHRKYIRKKLGINNTKINLNTHLKTLK